MTNSKKISEGNLGFSELDRLFFSKSPIGIAVYNEVGDCVSANETFGKTTGVTKEQVLSQNYMQIQAWKETGLLQTALKAVQTQSSHHQILKLISSFDKPLEIDCYLVPIVHHNKNYLLVTIADVSKRIEVEKALQESEDRWQFAVDGSGLGLWDWNYQTNEVFFSQQWKSMLGFREDEISGHFKEWEKRLHPDDKPRVFADLNRHLDGETPIYINEYRIQCKDGSFKWILDHGKVMSRNEDGKPLRVIGTHTDISLLKKTTTDLMREKDFSSKIIENSVTSIIGLDAHHQILLFNKGAENVTGFLREDVIGQDWFEIFIAPEQHLEMKKVWEDAWNQDVSFNDNPIIIKNGEQRNLSWTNSIIKDESGQPTMLICFGTDITERRKIENKLAQSRKMEAIGQLAGGIAHDFNNILAGILGSAEVLQNFSNNTLEELEFITMIINDANRAANLTSKLLTFSRKETVSMGPVDINQVINNTMTILERSLDKRISISVQHNTQSSLVKGNASQLENALLNIGINASQAMPRGGKLEFITSIVFLDDYYCDANPFILTPGEYLKLEIRDEGIGIPIENIEKIFDPFFTTKRRGKGTGLGLSVVYGIIQDHHAAINVYSEMGVGTVFHIFLPLSIESPVQEETPVEVLFGTGTILVVDDDNIIRKYLKKMIESLGYSVLLAENGQIALEIYQDQQTSIDLVVLDMIMPVMGGKETFFHLRELNPKCKILISSGFVQSEDLSLLEEHGLSGFIRKPYQKAKLSQDLTSILKSEK